MNDHTRTSKDEIKLRRDIMDPARLLEAVTNRKEYPMAVGLIDYFPDALAAVAHVSKVGNDKHNSGEDIHWARGKSMDHADCIARHLVERGGFEVDGIRHSAYLAWRALALLQEELELAHNLPLPRGARDAPNTVAKPSVQPNNELPPGQDEVYSDSGVQEQHRTPRPARTLRKHRDESR